MIYDGHFAWQLLRKYKIAFGQLLNNIEVARWNNDGIEVSRERVPIVHSNKEKFYIRTEEDPDLNKKALVKSPRMGFEMVGLAYNSERKLNPIGQAVSIVNGKIRKQLNPVP